MSVRTITLDGQPHVALLMTRATATAAGRSGALPDTEVVQRGVRTDLDHLARYDRVCGFAVSDVLPATFVHVLTFGLQLTLMAEPDFPLPLPGLVHVANRVEQVRPVRAEEHLDLSVRSEALSAHPKGRQVDLVGEARVDGEVVWRGRSTYLARGSSSGLPAAQDRHVDVALDRAAPPTSRWRLPADLGRRYARVSGDVNPIHLTALAAKGFGFPRAIAHGMWTMARCVSALQPRLPDAYVADVEFRRPVLLPSSVELRTRSVDGGYDVVVSSREGEHLRGTIR
ncbi:MaoC/PaaZ C-terminal domain-containing protein [Angustibacter sp. Root456]|uniref:MaoC/PaaZ C-terminal domain-containing protein n=1 Tax=Angustibacter sp. Root456 TaxID=1736539 RepID=UPI001910C82D|nr:MaoC/PaaZ C-terminal domain-containing protein [Angustibacter sp. Root456]